MKRAAKETIEVERRIAASPETVFSFFTDPSLYQQWQGDEAELDPRPGGVFRVRMSGKSHITAVGQYLEVDPPHRLVYTWGFERETALLDEHKEVAPGQSRVEVQLTADGGGTLLRLRHSGLPSEGSCQFHTDGWEFTLDRLKTAAEGGDPGPNPWAEL
jgi:uncharacterized protein YndB with AHSA1/START domain